jgi:hypothetical protein
MRGGNRAATIAQDASNYGSAADRARSRWHADRRHDPTTERSRRALHWLAAADRDDRGDQELSDRPGRTSRRTAADGAQLTGTVKAPGWETRRQRERTSARPKSSGDSASSGWLSVPRVSESRANDARSSLPRSRAATPQIRCPRKGNSKSRAHGAGAPRVRRALARMMPVIAIEAAVRRDDHSDAVERESDHLLCAMPIAGQCSSNSQTATARSSTAGAARGDRRRDWRAAARDLGCIFDALTGRSRSHHLMRQRR